MRVWTKCFFAVACAGLFHTSAFAQSIQDRLPQEVYRIDRVDCPIKGPPPGIPRIGQPHLCVQDPSDVKQDRSLTIPDRGGIFGGPNSIFRKPLGL
jgi:hypothetical protein